MRAAKVLGTGFTATTLALACAPLLGMRPAVWVVLAWVLSAVVHRGFAKASRPAPDMRTFLLLAAPFLVMVLDIARAQDPAGAWHIAERSAMLLIAPFVVFVLRPPVDDALRDRAADVFALAALALAFLANLGILAEDITGPTPFAHRYRAAFAMVTGIHPPFAAYFFLCGALFLLDRVLCDATYRWPRSVAFALLILAGALIASRTPLIAFILAAVVLLGMRLPRKRIVPAVLAMLGTGLVTVMAVPTARDRMVEPFRTAPALPTTTNVNSVNERFVIGHCTLALLRDHWVAGLGQASVQPALDMCYTRFDDPRYRNGSYSTHCQPLHWWLSFGLVGPLLFLALFAVPMRAAWRAHDPRLMAFLLFFGLCCLTENVLARQWGVVPFALLLSLLAPSLFAGGRKARARSHA